MGQTEILRTLGIDLLLLGLEDLDERIAYQITEQYVAAMPGLSATQPTAGFVNLEEALATPIQLLLTT